MLFLYNFLIDELIIGYYEPLNGAEHNLVLYVVRRKLNKGR